VKYRDFSDDIDMDAFYEGIGFLPLYEKGDEDIGFCPDPWEQHKNGDSTGKLAFNREKKVFNCWVCGGGNLLSWAMASQNLDPEEATDWLEQFADFGEKADEEFLSDIKKILSQLDPKREEVVLPYFNDNVLNRWSGTSVSWKEAADYPEPSPWDWFEERGISLDVALRFAIGYDHKAVKYPPRNKKTGEPLGDPYQGPAMVLPHFWKGRLVGWQHRWLLDDRPKWCAKYTNTSDFPKRYTLWNFDGVHGRALPPVVVESVPTAVMIESLGWPAIATFGASITPEQLKLLRRFQQGVIFAPDNDRPGLEGLVKAVDYLGGFIPVSWIDPTDWGVGHDLIDYKNSRENALQPTVRDLIENPLRIS
jgi:hypothetical protein